MIFIYIFFNFYEIGMILSIFEKAPSSSAQTERGFSWSWVIFRKLLLVSKYLPGSFIYVFGIPFQSYLKSSSHVLYFLPNFQFGFLLWIAWICLKFGKIYLIHGCPSFGVLRFETWFHNFLRLIVDIANFFEIYVGYCI